jgi:hypothetical protein
MSAKTWLEFTPHVPPGMTSADYRHEFVHPRRSSDIPALRALDPGKVLVSFLGERLCTLGCGPDRKELGSWSHRNLSSDNMTSCLRTKRLSIPVSSWFSLIARASHDMRSSLFKTLSGLLCEKISKEWWYYEFVPLGKLERQEISISR